MAPYQIHNVRFFDLQPKAGQCLAYCEERKLLALSRSDTSIEIWNFKCQNSPILERIISGNESEGSIEALAWAKPKSGTSSDPKDWRLFSAGLHGLVIEHRLEVDEVEEYTKYSPRRNTWPVTSGAGWCMKFNESVGKLAIGTEEGYICIFDVTSEGLDFDKVLDKQEGRILCLDWHSDGKQIVTGSPDTLRLWDVSTGHPLLRMSTGRSEKNRETIVWSVAIMDDFTIVSGDSRGKTSFWNGKTGTQVDSYQTHKADVLCVAVDKNQEAVYSSGVDPVLMQFQPVFKNDQRRKWVKSLHRNSNTHDVRAIACLEDKRVASVGVDSNLCISQPGCSVVKYPPIPFGENVVLAPQSNMIALRKQTSVEVWKLGRAHPENFEMEEDYSHIKSEFSSKFLALQDQPLKVLELQSKDSEPIENFHMSKNGDYIGYITGTKIRIYRLEITVDKKSVDKKSLSPSLRRVDLKLRPNKIPHTIHFYKHNTTDFLLTVTAGIGLKCYQIATEDMSTTPIFRLLPSQMQLASDISKIATNATGTFCVVSDYEGQAVVVDLSAEKVSAKFPKSNMPISCIAINPKTDNVVIVYSDNRFVECNSKSGKNTKFSATFLSGELQTFLPKQFLAKSLPTAGVIFPDSSKSPYDDTILFYDSQNIFVFEKSALTTNETQTEGSTKISKTGNAGSKIPAKPSAMRVTKKYEHLIYLGSTVGKFQNENGPNLVAVEVRPEALEVQLPPSLRQKKFGAM